LSGEFQIINNQHSIIKKILNITNRWRQIPPRPEIASYLAMTTPPSLQLSLYIYFGEFNYEAKYSIHAGAYISTAVESISLKTQRELTEGGGMHPPLL
jgi:hypothetical protein